MPEQRLPCRSPNCVNTIQAATARRTGGYCGPCAGKIARAERENHIRKNRRDVDLFAGVTDPVEMLWIHHQPRRHDPLVNILPAPRTLEQLYRELDPRDANAQFRGHEGVYYAFLCRACHTTATTYQQT